MEASHFLIFLLTFVFTCKSSANRKHTSYFHVATRQREGSLMNHWLFRSFALRKWTNSALEFLINSFSLSPLLLQVENYHF